MSRIKGEGTKPELAFRKSLWKRGVRYRISSDLPGRPDIVITKFCIAIFIDGCFWHKCPKHYVKPTTRNEFWQKKISGNVDRDNKNNQKLKEMGWTVIRIWEHEIKEDLQGAVDKVVKLIEKNKKSQTI